MLAVSRIWSTVLLRLLFSVRFMPVPSEAVDTGIPCDDVDVDVSSWLLLPIVFWTVLPGISRLNHS